ncbi:MAG TPA: hypothetical protein VIU37_01340, partial [Candidatus Limnocylindrales bacterium]
MRRTKTSSKGVEQRRRAVTYSLDGSARRFRSTLLLDAVLLSCLACAAPTNRLEVAGTVEIRDIGIAPLAAGRVVRLLKD